ncbi:hypothetical protein CCMSSC00406_0002355 [Pleurotus cornucopiae]|uniref:Uncharacterized protein n=1 Tax=Pleurotus cornucopiae TaxID=5321 RepID=A0ACB7J392_PLECO|nr:hypothetical protein CCMSSC00406_0002355 [Pleurotus cornucopiae]
MSDYSASYNHSQYWWQPHAQPELSLGPAEHIGSDEQDPNFRGQGSQPSNHPGPLLDDYDDYTYAEHAPFRNATSCPESHWQEAPFDGQRSSSDPPNPLDEIYTGQVTPFQYATFGQDLLWQGLPSQGGSSYSRSTSLGSELRGRGLFDRSSLKSYLFFGLEADL